MTAFTVTKRTRKGFAKLALDEVSDETLIEMAGQALTRPSDSAWWDDEMFVTHCQMFSTVDPDLSDEDLVGLSNYHRIGEDLRAVWPKSASESSFRHWTYSRFLALKVRVLTGDGESREIHPAFAAACSIAIKLRDSYPIYDDEDYSAREYKLWDDLDVETEAELRGELADEDDEDHALSGEDLTLYVADFFQWLHEHDGQGYRSEAYYPEEVIAEARAWARNRVGMVRHSYDEPSLF